ncbi:MAG: glycosyltransferase family 9 protein [Desulfovibrio sp.]|jgi:ADP-heptose:LPS heptosyltransferase|nr:glycosyltransferase family 9 protein [Desulfovibrio sp.]
MSADPLLILQLQRMGDLILAFPLIETLQRRMPGHPVWVAAEPQFFKELMPLSPQVVFFPPSHCKVLARGRYALAVNLSSRPEAAQCLARLEAPAKLGPAALGDGLSIYGHWNLYRAALTQNNRHNAFHWADLYLMDIMEGAGLAAVGHSLPRGAGGRRVGLMLGASEAAKRPDADFWARLARRLVRAQAGPVFLGGKAEIPLGEEVAKKSGLPRANLCGRLSLAELAQLLPTLALFITPDTGPMHLADRLGVPVLNLSMGPVHARETGPRSPGQWILRASLSCVGCWQCVRATPRCKRAFTPKAVAEVALSLLDNPQNPALPPLNRLVLFRTGRDAQGLYRLESRRDTPSCRALLEDFWQAAFLHSYDPSLRAPALTRLRALRETFPALHQRLGSGLARLTAHCSARLRHAERFQPDFWRSETPLLRLFTGWLHMFLQNSRYSRDGWNTALERLTLLRGLFE